MRLCRHPGVTVTRFADSARWVNELTDEYESPFLRGMFAGDRADIMQLGSRVNHACLAALGLIAVAERVPGILLP